VPDNVSYFNPSMTPQIAAQWGRAVVLDLLIEAEARRTHDANLAATGAVGDGLKVFTDISNQDAAAGKFVATSYSFDHLSLNLFLPKFKTQASRLVGITVTGTVTLVTRDQSGRLLSQTTGPYSRSWSMDDKQPDGGQPIFNDFSDLALAH
jgi:hypothetical protein